MLNEIFTKIIKILDDKYTVITSFDAESEIDLNGVLAVNVTDFQLQHNGNTKDCKYTVTINGQFLTEQDKNRQKINEMFDYVFQIVDADKIKQEFENCAGVVLSGGSIVSDGETNNFSFSMDLYFCID